MKTNLLGRLFSPEHSGKWRMPTGTYWLIRAFHSLRPLLFHLSGLETRLLGKELDGITIDRPIFICGIARSGTTITLEMLHHHPDAACHLYYHAPLPHLPVWWDRTVTFLPLPISKPVERLHRDGLLVNQKSPDAIEERLWMDFFPDLHDEQHSNVLSENHRNERFEAFYRDHIRKLLYRQDGKRYLTKNNYNITRLEYLLKLFPDARFLLLVRDPADHIASLMKQHRLFTALELGQPGLSKWLNIVGHYEFGTSIQLINTGEAGAVDHIRDLWSRRKYVQGWAAYWASIYHFVADRLERNPALAAASLIVRYEDLCADSGGAIDRILSHTGLPAETFSAVRERYVRRLQPPRYYKPDFSRNDLNDIRMITQSAARRCGYDRPASCSPP